MKYGSKSTTFPLGNSTRTNIEVYNDGERVKTLKSYRIKVRVQGTQDEMTEFIKFTDKLRQLHSQGKLAVIKENPTTHPAFVFEYIKDNFEDGHFIYKCYTTLAWRLWYNPDRNEYQQTRIRMTLFGVSVLNRKNSNRNL